MSLRQQENYVEMPKLIAQRILKTYKTHISQELRVGDLERQILLCHLLVQKCKESSQFPLKVFRSDESRSPNDGVFNRPNNVLWITKIPSET